MSNFNEPTEIPSTASVPEPVPSPAPEDREVLTYEKFGEVVREMAQTIVDDWEPDIILSVARGGFFLGGGLGYAIGLKAVSVLNVEFYTGINERLDEPVILAPTPNPSELAGMKVLVADDVADSGETLKMVKDFLAPHAEEVRTATLFEKPTTVVHPDYVWKTTDKWIDFPWSCLPTIVPAGSDKESTDGH